MVPVPKWFQHGTRPNEERSSQSFGATTQTCRNPSHLEHPINVPTGVHGPPFAAYVETNALLRTLEIFLLLGVEQVHAALQFEYRLQNSQKFHVSVRIVPGIFCTWPFIFRATQRSHSLSARSNLEQCKPVSFFNLSWSQRAVEVIANPEHTGAGPIFVHDQVRADSTTTHPPRTQALREVHQCPPPSTHCLWVWMASQGPQGCTKCWASRAPNMKCLAMRWTQILFLFLAFPTNLQSLLKYHLMCMWWLRCPRSHLETSWPNSTGRGTCCPR